jgi:MtfA peptidase
MVFSWLKTRRREKLLVEPCPAAWLTYLASNVRHYRHLEPSKQALMRQVVQVFVAEKHWAGGGGLSVTDEMKVTVAGQAALLVLGSPAPYYYDQVLSIILYPRHYARPRRIQEHHLVVSEDWHVSGEAWYRGPIVLSWEDVLASGRDASDGHDVTLHEFAHHLDGLNGELDGAPPLNPSQRPDWCRVTEAEYLRLVGNAQRHEVTLLDHYGARSPVEFFAVATECFFEQPRAMRRLHEELYGVLRDFYRQDPADWCPDATVRHSHRDLENDGQRDEPTDEELQEMLTSDDPEKLFTLGMEHLDGKRYRSAIQLFSRVIQIDPSDAEAYQQRARAEVQLADHAAALTDAEEALRLHADDVTGYLARGAAYLGLRQYEQARADLNRVLYEQRNDPEAYYLRGIMWAALGKWRKAVSDFSWSIVYRPHFANAYAHRAYAHRQLGSFAKADADLERAFQLDPQVGWRK